MLINIDHIADLTGSTRRTVLKRCQDLQQTKGKGRAILYESKDALPLMYGIGSQGSSSSAQNKMNYDQERTRLASAQADKTELEVEVIKGNLIPSENVEEVVNTMVSAFRAKMLSLPTKAAHVVVAMADPATIEEALREYIYEALGELSEYRSEQYCTSSDKQSGKAGSTTTSTDSKPVGRQQAKTVKGSKRRTRTVEH